MAKKPTPQQRYPRKKFLSQQAGGLAASETDLNPACHDPCRLAWESLADHFESVHKEFKDAGDAILANECSAAASVIHRVLTCHESGTQALSAVRAVFVRVSMVLSYTSNTKYTTHIEGLRTSLEDVCRLSPCEKCQKSAQSCECGKRSEPCGCGEGFTTGFSHYGQWLEVEHAGVRLYEVIERFGKTLGEVGSANFPSGKSLLDSNTTLLEAAEAFAEVVTQGRTAAASCDPKAAADALEALYNATANLTSAYDQMQCDLNNNSCGMLPVFYDILQAEADGIGLLSSTLLRAVHKISAPCCETGNQLKIVWHEMQCYEAGPVKEAFCRFERHQLCPPEHCYDKATAELRRIIAHGFADCEGLALDAYGCDEARFARHRLLIDMAVQEINRLDCKDWEGFDRCVWTRMGSFTMRLYAILGRTTNIVADQVRTLADSILHLRTWFGDMTQEPPQDVVPFLRAGLAILRSLETRANSSGICAYPATGPCAEYGQMELRIVDDNDQPLPGCKVQIATQAGQKREVIADANGYIRELLPKGPYTVSGAGGEFPALTMVV